MSAFGKDCPQCGQNNPSYAVRCRCGYEFNATLDDVDGDRDLEMTVQEEELYLEYLAARAEQMASESRVAAAAAQVQPNNAEKATEAERTRAAAERHRAEFESQKARVASAKQVLKGGGAPAAGASKAPLRPTPPPKAAAPATPPSPTPARTDDNTRPAPAKRITPNATVPAKPAAGTTAAAARASGTDARLPLAGTGSAPASAPATPTAEDKTAKPAPQTEQGRTREEPPKPEQLAAAARAAAAAQAKKLAETLQAARGAISQAGSSASIGPGNTPPAAPQERTAVKPATTTSASAPPVKTNIATKADTPAAAKVRQDPALAPRPLHDVEWRERQPLTSASNAGVVGADSARPAPVVDPAVPQARKIASPAATQATAKVNGSTGSVGPAKAIDASPIQPTGRSSPIPSASHRNTLQDPETPGRVQPAQRAPSAPPASAAKPEQDRRSDPRPPASTPSRTPEPGAPAQAAADTSMKECPNCTGLVPINTARCRCGFKFPKIAETMPGLSLSDAELAAIDDNLKSTGITHL